MPKRRKMQFKKMAIRSISLYSGVYIKFNLLIRVPYKNCFKKTKYKWVKVISIEKSYMIQSDLNRDILSGYIERLLYNAYEESRKIKIKVR